MLVNEAFCFIGASKIKSVIIATFMIHIPEHTVAITHLLSKYYYKIEKALTCLTLVH